MDCQPELATSSSAATVSQPRRLVPRRRKPIRKFICVVCGDLASGINFGAIACESCKSFYRRHASQRYRITCAADGTCQLNRQNRRFCAACRLKKCFDVGMKGRFYRDEDENGQPSERVLRRRMVLSRLRERLTIRKSQSQSQSQPQPQSPSQPDLPSQVHAGDDCSLAKASDTASTTSSEDTDQSDLVSASASSIASPEMDNSTSVAKTACDSIADSKYEEVYNSILTAAKILREEETETQPSEKQENSFIRLAIGRYVAALRQFPDFIKLGRIYHHKVINRRFLAQINLYAIFTVNSDVSGWVSVDSSGSSHENAFDCFTASLALDGVDARAYVECFRMLVSTFRSIFERDWPILIITLSLIDLCSLYSPKSSLSTSSDTDSGTGTGTGSGSGSGSGTRIDSDSDSCDALSVKAARIYKSFLLNYLRRNMPAKSELWYRYCTQQFPRELEMLVQLQTRLVSQISAKRSGRVDEVFISASEGCVADLFSPVICEFVKQLSE